MEKLIKTFICLTAFFLLSSQVMAQQEADKSTEQEGLFLRFIHNEKVALKLDYFGELVLHPGLSLGVDYTLSKKTWVSLHWDTDIGGYWHQWRGCAGQSRLDDVCVQLSRSCVRGQWCAAWYARCQGGHRAAAYQSHSANHVPHDWRRPPCGTLWLRPVGHTGRVVQSWRH